MPLPFRSIICANAPSVLIKMQAATKMHESGVEIFHRRLAVRLTLIFWQIFSQFSTSVPTNESQVFVRIFCGVWARASPEYLSNRMCAIFNESNKWLRQFLNLF